VSTDVQLENGFTRIANEILDALAKTSLNGTQRRILDVVFRQTYGYKRKSHDLSVTFIANATNIHKKQIQREIITLIEKNIIAVVSEATFNKSRVISFNKKYNEWVDSSEVTKKLPTNTIDTHTGNELDVSTGNGLAPQIKKKENSKEIVYSPDEMHEAKSDTSIYKDVVEYLNQSCGTKYKPNSRKTKTLIDARVNEGFKLEDFIKVIDVKSSEWLNNNMAMYLRPETLFGTKFEGYLNQKNNLKKGSDVVGKFGNKFGNAIKFDIPKSNRETSRTENLDNEIKELGLI
jgi:phage replication O-like protein O